MAIKEFKWRKGNPPHPGWWLANSIRSRAIWSFWDGRNWSMGYLDSDSIPETVEQLGLRWSPPEWCWHWPKGARVKRINPATGEGTGPVPSRRRKAQSAPVPQPLATRRIVCSSLP